MGAVEAVPFSNHRQVPRIAAVGELMNAVQRLRATIRRLGLSKTRVAGTLGWSTSTLTYVLDQNSEPQREHCREALRRWLELNEHAPSVEALRCVS